MRWVILETPYDDNQIPIEKFSRSRYQTLLDEYKRDSEWKYDPATIRKYMRVYYWDDNTDEEEDIEGLSWFAPEDSDERVGEPLLPGVPGWEER